jgi:tetratricopeptide (TPR) repeat protein
MRVADRRREIEQDPSMACRQAATLLRRIGQHEAAWDYLTTPLALRPGEAEPWVNLAEALKAQGADDMADRAYAAAFDVEGSNPQHLWDRAQLAQQHGRFAEARQFYRQIAEGTWPPQHAGLKQQARAIVGP